MFTYLRRKVAEAMAAGAEDFLRSLGESDASAAEALRERLSPAAALPAHEGDPEPANGKARQKAGAK